MTNAANFSLAYCTNIWTHHQAPVCQELANLLGVDRFKMGLFSPVHEERRKLGWENEVPDLKWVMGPPRSKSDSAKLRETVLGADVAVLGAVPTEIQLERAQTGKLTFLMGERFIRHGFFRLRMLNPRFARGINTLRSIANRPNVHFLAIGAYAPDDARVIGLFEDRVWWWGYFVPEAKQAYQERRNSRVKILWAGRLLKLKKVDVLLRALASIKTRADFELQIVGSGPAKESLIKLAHRLKLDDRVRFSESVPPAEVRQLMAKADIYVFPSNHLEGWGAVVSEAMSEGCVTVASAAAGASKILIEDGRNGFIFPEGDVAQLASILETVLKGSQLRRAIGEAAMTALQTLWHPACGAQRLVSLSSGLLGTAPMQNFAQGPCSNAWSNKVSKP